MEQARVPDFVEDGPVTTLWGHHPHYSKALADDLSEEDYAEWAEYTAKQPTTLHHLHRCYRVNL